MLYIRYQHGITTHDVSVYVGETLKINPQAKILECVADGQEADKCLAMVGKQCTKRTVQFFGDDQKFIVFNW